MVARMTLAVLLLVAGTPGFGLAQPAGGAGPAAVAVPSRGARPAAGAMTAGAALPAGGAPGAMAPGSMAPGSMAGGAMAPGSMATPGSPESGLEPATPSTDAYRHAMGTMHEAMMAEPYTGDADRDFVGGMLPHHQGAIDMARVELRYGRDPAMRRLAQDIIVAQTREAVVMRRWQAGHGGGSGSGSGAR